MSLTSVFPLSLGEIQNLGPPQASESHPDSTGASPALLLMPELWKLRQLPQHTLGPMGPMLVVTRAAGPQGLGHRQQLTQQPWPWCLPTSATGPGWA